MPKATLRDEDEYPLPEDTAFPAQLKAVTERVIHYRDRNDGQEKSFTKWVWRFKVTDGDYAGLSAFGETEDRLSNHPDNLVRQWAETLRGKPFALGDGLDTDDLLGLNCLITVRHDPPRPRRDGGNFYPCLVADVLPPDALGGWGFPDEPPF